VAQQQLAPLQPFTEQIEGAAGFAADDTAAVRRDKLRAALAPADEQDLALVAALLGMPFERHFRHLDELQPRQRRARTLQALLRVVAGITRRGPVLLIVEDAHWCDPTSRELLGLIAAEIADLPMLLVVTSRPGIPTAWTSRHVSLEPLGAIESALLVETVAAGAGLPEDLVGTIVARSDGVPLFLEELTRTVLDDAECGRADGAQRADDNQAPVPSSLRALLTSRLDRLGAAREIASIAAVIGREFSLGMLSRIASMRLRTLRDGLSRLVESGLVLSRRGGAGGYRFKHALVHDAAYGLMTRSRRAVFHERIAAALETIAQAQPQRIAHHWIEAGAVRKAVEWSVRAGTESLRRLSAEETISQLRRGLALLEKCPDDEWTCRSELTLRLLIGKAQLAARTHADQGATATFTRARALCDRLPDPPELLSVLFAQCFQSFVRAEHATALQRAEEVLALGESRHDRAWTAAGCFMVGMTSLPIGNLAAARSHFERGIVLYDAARRDAYGRPFIGDPLVNMRTFLSAYALTALGRVDEARRMSDQALADARRIDQMWSLTSALTNRGFMTYTLGSHEESLNLWAEAHRLARDLGFVHFEALSTMGRGWCVAALGEAREGLALARLGLDTLRRTRCRLLVSTYVLHEAVILGRLGENAEALSRVAAAMRLARRTGALWDLAEMHRVRGELLWDSGEQSASLRAFERALRAARHNGARLFEQRVRQALSERANGRTALPCTNTMRRAAGAAACVRAPT
jgi:predicted ATPase